MKAKLTVGQQLFGAHYTLHHRLVIGACLAVGGVVLMKLKLEIHVLDLMIEAIGTFINALGLTPYIDQLMQAAREEE